MKKGIKKLFGIAVAGILASAAVSGFGGISVKAEESDLQKYAFDPGVYTVKMDDSVTETVHYKHKESYLFNERETTGNISLKFKTVSASVKDNTPSALYGLVRGASTDIAYGYVNAYWYLFGNHVAGSGGKTIYKENAVTDITYDTVSHSFGVVIDGEDQTKNDLMMSFAGNTKTAEACDEEGASIIQWDVMNVPYEFEATLEDFALTDENGYDLGITMSANANNFTKELSETFYGYAGKTVTIKLFTNNTTPSFPAALDENGRNLGVVFNELGNNEFSFVMPESEFSLVCYRETGTTAHYGSYRSANGDMYVLGDTSYKLTRSGKTDLKLKAFDNGALFIFEGDALIESILKYGDLMIGDERYEKLLSYTVEFISDGKSVQTATVNSGDYILQKPESDPQKEGYKFVGWKTGDGKAYDFSATVTHSITLYADFEPLNHQDPKPVSGGCGSSVNAGAFALLAVAAIILKRKNER